jgi:type II secretory pathway pseudopilin PulG
MTIPGRLRRADGFALIPTLIVLIILMGLGAAALSTADVQSHQTGVERAGEAAFNLAESALDDEVTQAIRVWPGSAATAYPVCTQSSAVQANPLPGCPGVALTANYTAADAGPDFLTTPVWKVQLVDDTGSGGASYYNDSLAGTAPAWDSNGDGKIWVRAEATVGRQRRIVVAQIGEQTQGVVLPPDALIAGGFSTDNNGNKIIVYTQNPANPGSVTGKLLVRCGDSSTVPAPGNSCLGFDAGKGQLSPAGSYQAGYVDTSGTGATLSPSTLAGMKAYAIANGSYYAAGQCPASLTGGLIYIENANCSYTTGTFNAKASPGAVAFGAGTLTLGGNVTYYGVVYAANGQGSPPPCTASNENTVVTLIGTALIQGAIFIDNCGTLSAGASAANLIFDASALSGLKTLAAPSMGKNTFRLLPNP